MKKYSKSATATVPRFELLFQAKWMFEGAANMKELYTTMENWARDLREMEKLGIKPLSRVKEGQTCFETDDAAVAKKFGFEKRPSGQSID